MADYKSVEFDIRHKNVMRNVIQEMRDLNKCNKVFSLQFKCSAYIEEYEEFMMAVRRLCMRIIRIISNNE